MSFKKCSLFSLPSRKAPTPAPTASGRGFVGFWAEHTCRCLRICEHFRPCGRALRPVHTGAKISNTDTSATPPIFVGVRYCVHTTLCPKEQNAIISFCSYMTVCGRINSQHYGSEEETGKTFRSSLPNCCYCKKEREAETCSLDEKMVKKKNGKGQLWG